MNWLILLSTNSAYTMKLRCFVFLLGLFTSHFVGAQYPHYFAYDDERNLPNNEVYSIIQDQRGFIWIGCDAGLYKFDGIRFVHYACATQQAKSMTGLVLSPSGKLYGYNFKAQLFYLENDTLRELKHDFPKIWSLALDKQGAPWVNHDGGISKYDEGTKKWATFTSFGRMLKDAPKHYTHSARMNENGEMCFINTEGIGKFKQGKIVSITINEFANQPPGRFKMETFGASIFLIATDGSIVIEENQGALRINESKKLLTVLANKKINNIKALEDGNLWICTYSGLICFNPKTDEVKLYYPGFAFSDAIIDREKHYWFTTLHAGVLRVPNLDFLVWNAGKDFPLTNKLSRLVHSGDELYFATMNGVIGKLNQHTHDLQVFSLQNNQDIQCFHYDSESESLFFYVGRDLYQLKKNIISIVQKDMPSLKSIVRVQNEWIWMCSSGTFIHEMGAPWVDKKPIFDYWSREAQSLGDKSIFAVATNFGLMFLDRVNNKWTLISTLFEDIQILSLAYRNDDEALYVLTFEGQIYRVESVQSFSLVCQLPDDVRANRIQLDNNQIYIASNQGLFIYDLNSNKFDNLNHLNGLASNNIQDLLIDANYIWLATGRGLQRIPKQFTKATKKALIYLKNNDEQQLEVKLNYSDPIILKPEVSSFASHGQFSYAYRINQGEWIVLPGNIEQIEIQNMPRGNFHLELKAIDYLGRDSENSIRVNGYVRPPFWQTWWFAALIFVGLLFIVLLIAKKLIANIRKREKEKTALVHSQLTALKAQMNPHFMYNALNSIQALILKQDIKNSNLYLSQFSSLMRLVLEVSEKEEVSLAEETKILNLYLSLEKLRFGTDFHYQIKLADDLDSEQIGLPPLILQPFVENAIKHGLLHKKGEKHLSIDFQIQNEFLQCVIEDNGIGRQHAMEIKQRQTEASASFSTNATEKRVQLFNTYQKQNMQIDIVDLMENQTPTGTKVIILIPLH